MTQIAVRYEGHIQFVEVTNFDGKWWMEYLREPIAILKKWDKDGF